MKTQHGERDQLLSRFWNINRLYFVLVVFLRRIGSLYSAAFAQAPMLTAVCGDRGRDPLVRFPFCRSSSGVCCTGLAIPYSFSNNLLDHGCNHARLPSYFVA